MTSGEIIPPNTDTGPLCKARREASERGKGFTEQKVDGWMEAWLEMENERRYSGRAECSVAGVGEKKRVTK